jgi:selenide,water dikinase
MGGTPTHALNLLCFPNCLSLEIAGAILAGGADKAMEANCTIAGGHSITDNEPKYGLCVSGIVDPKKLLANNTGRPGDILIATKALGTGILTTAYKGEMISEAELQPAVESMRMLNKAAAEAAFGLEVHACTDITGFGMAGHLCEMAEGCGLTATVYHDRLPILPNALEMARMGMCPGGTYRNRVYFGEKLDLSAAPEEYRDVMLDPQTSGGLLFAIAEKDAEILMRRLRDAGVAASTVGDLSVFDGVSIRAK